MWQPIETAPKDGEWLDLWVVCTNPNWRPEGEEYRVTDAKWLDGRWQQYYDQDGAWDNVEDRHYRATHWIRPGRPNQQSR